eukprot:CAMPEP_0180165772 /NCGR_PEP_ID=MMETSP0986-20121125/31165_1 /TAXON_ID=697907 /ORGANISM="non described non described, Strain CCMP2293" /LENGTH=132 /DNA_ID=CAMNT_0022116805 /DNA_START=12 /DNA_END=408 /DNA_ORIENTATION=-
MRKEALNRIVPSRTLRGTPLFSRNVTDVKSFIYEGCVEPHRPFSDSARDAPSSQGTSRSVKTFTRSARDASDSFAPLLTQRGMPLSVGERHGTLVLHKTCEERVKSHHLSSGSIIPRISEGCLALGACHEKP